MVPVARRMASLLRVPLTIDGKPVEASEELTEAINHVVESGDAVSVGAPELRINCPRCGARNVPGLAYDYVERFKGIPFTTTWVKCGRCRTPLFAKIHANELEGRSADELEQFVLYRPPAAMLRKSLAVMALVIGPVPMVGLVVSIPAVIANWTHVRWAKVLSLIGLVLSVTTTTLVIIVLVNNPPDRQMRTPPLQVPHTSEE
ncbi:MAG TPA: hypothetical protein VK797_25185 [Tepidisphaeraceae bacterium]|nr:hypothetical protein [Tepidisphaeraceae bacterium]